MKDSKQGQVVTVTRVELVAGSLKGLMALARAQKAKVVGAAIWDKGEWHMPVQLPDRGFKS